MFSFVQQRELSIFLIGISVALCAVNGENEISNEMSFTWGNRIFEEKISTTQRIVVDERKTKLNDTSKNASVEITYIWRLITESQKDGPILFMRNGYFGGLVAEPKPRPIQVLCSKVTPAGLVVVFNQQLGEIRSTTSCWAMIVFHSEQLKYATRPQENIWYREVPAPVIGSEMQTASVNMLDDGNIEIECTDELARTLIFRLNSYRSHEVTETQNAEYWRLTDIFAAKAPRK